jgi:methionine-rich copper-binding protein CopC
MLNLTAPLRPILFFSLALTLVMLPDLASASMEATGDPAPHLRLVRTTPAADTTVAASPAEIRLFFSEAPQMRGTSVRLADAANNLVASTEAAADAEDARQVWIAPEAPLAPGRYTVHWRVIAQDGHTQRGSFSFRVGGGTETH